MVFSHLFGFSLVILINRIRLRLWILSFIEEGKHIVPGENCRPFPFGIFNLLFSHVICIFIT